MATQITPMQDMAFIIGKWHTSGTITGQPDIKIHGTDSYEWVSAGAFILHRVDVMMGDENVQSVEIIGYDANAGQYVFRSFDSEGNLTLMHAELNSDGALVTQGNNMRSTLTVKDGNTMNATWERVDEGGDWQHWMDMQFSK